MLIVAKPIADVTPTFTMPVIIRLNSAVGLDGRDFRRVRRFRRVFFRRFFPNFVYFLLKC